MKLYLDTTNNLKTIVRLDEKELVKTYSIPQEQDILGAVTELLKRETAMFKDITAIEVNRGPGSFTGTRLGVAIANALAFALNICVNDQKPPIKPEYGALPNITSVKKN
jgi:tRNA threonylcarbamoyladenosine biosynthesis protein TsaB